MEGVQAVVQNPLTSTAVRALTAVLLIAALYYLYRYLVSPSTVATTLLFGGPISADTRNITVPDYGVNSLPALYEGGEYSVSMWLYINDYSYKRGYAKNVFSLGGDTFQTLLVSLSPYTNVLNCRLTTAASGTNGYIPTAAMKDMYETLMPAGAADTGTAICDLPNIDMQKWVLVTLVLSGRMCDVYMDGKLARSCTLPDYFKVDSAYKIKPLMYGGFGGYVSSLTAYGYAMNPDEVYRVYMAGPDQKLGFWDTIKSFFDPKSNIGFDYPKMNGQ
jgi:hypothetical protein